MLVCNPRRIALLKEGNKSDKVDARKLAELLRTGMLRPVYHGENGLRTLRELGQQRSDPSDESAEGTVSRLGHFSQNSGNLEDRKCLPELRKLFVGILMQSFFCHFLGSEFSTSHAC